MSDRTTVGKWLETKYLEWQLQQGKKCTLKEWATYLEIPLTTLTNYMKGKRAPSGDHVFRIAHKLGNEIYTLLSFKQNPQVLELIDLFAQLEPDEQSTVLEDVRQRVERKGQDEIRLWESHIRWLAVSTRCINCLIWALGKDSYRLHLFSDGTHLMTFARWRERVLARELDKDLLLVRDFGPVRLEELKQALRARK